MKDTGAQKHSQSSKCMRRGQSDEAMHWLERAYAKKDFGLFLVKGDPLLKSLEVDPRFKAFLRKMNLPE